MKKNNLQKYCMVFFVVEGAAMGYGYVQAGQENSFTWKKMGQGFKIQMPMIAQLLKELTDFAGVLCRV